MLVGVGWWVRARSAMPRGKGRGRREREEEQRSLREEDSEESEESEDEEEEEEYDKSVDHASSVAITDADIDGAATYYTIEVYSGDPPKWTWRVEKRYSEVDEFRKALVKRWKKDLPGDFPKKVLTLTQLDKAAQDERKRKLELWLNNVLAIADQKRTTSLRKGLEDMSVKTLTKRARQIDVDEDELDEALDDGGDSDEDGDGHTYKPLDKVEVFSNSAQAWCTGKVQTVDRNAGTVKVQYTNDKGVPTEKMLRADSEDIKPAKADVKGAVIALILEAMRAGTGGQQLQKLRQELSPTTEKGAQMVSDFLAPERERDVGPVTKAATLDRDKASFDQEDEWAYDKKEAALRKARKRDPEFEAKAEARKKEAIQSPQSADGSSRYDSDESDDEDWSERAEECFEKVQDCMSYCYDKVKSLCEDCAAKCKEYSQVDSDEEDEERAGRTRPSRAGTAPAKLSSR